MLEIQESSSSPMLQDVVPTENEVATESDPHLVMPGMSPTITSVPMPPEFAWIRISVTAQTVAIISAHNSTMFLDLFNFLFLDVWLADRGLELAGKLDSGPA